MDRQPARIALIFLLSLAFIWLALATLRPLPPSAAQGAPEPAPAPLAPPTSPTLVISEVAWGGTAASPDDEWIELLNVSSQTVTLTGWVLTSTGGLSIALDGALAPGEFFLLERGDDATISDLPADQIYGGNNLLNGGDGLFLSEGALLVDAANADGGSWPAGSGAPDYRSMERIDPLAAGADGNWRANDTVHVNGLAADGVSPILGTPGQPNSAGLPLPPALPLLISEVLYDAQTPSTSGDEFIELCNPLTSTLDLSGYKVGDEETASAGEGMYHLPPGWTLSPGACLVVAKNAAQFAARFAVTPTFEVVVSGSGYTDTPAVPNLARYSSWGSGSLALANDGDEVLVLGPADQIVDSVAYGSGDYASLGLIPQASAPAPLSLQRLWPFDRDWMAADFYGDSPTPGSLSPLPAPPASPLAPALPGGMRAYWGLFSGRSTFGNGDGPPALAYARARANGLHFLALTDASADLVDLEWLETGEQALSATAPGQFVAWRGQTWSQPEAGSLTVVGGETLLSPENPAGQSLAALYGWLAGQAEAFAQFEQGGDFPFEPAVAGRINLFEVGYGVEPYLKFELPWLRALAVGWRAGPAIAAGGGGVQWGADTPHRSGVVAPDLAPAELLAAVRARRVFATEDGNLALAFRANGAWMGDSLPAAQPLAFEVYVVDGDGEGAALTLFDGAVPLATGLLATTPATWTAEVPGRAGHHYWVKAVQPDGDAAYSAPLWIEGSAAPQNLRINEVMPAPAGVDWNGDGLADADDEWLELHNPGPEPVGLGGWQLVDAAGSAYDFPLGAVVPPGGFYVLFPRPAGLALNNNGDALTLRRLDVTEADAFQYDRDPGDDLTWCLPPEGGPPSDRCLPTPGAANAVLPPAGPLQVSIFEAKHLTEGAQVRVRGRVTAPPDLLLARVMYIQDDHAGIQIYLPREHRLAFNPGDLVEVTGKLDLSSRHEWRIRVATRSDVRFVRPGDPVPPLPINSGVMVEPYEGMLVQLEARPVEFRRGSQSFWVDDGTGRAYVHLYRRTGLRRRGLQLGQALTVVGIVGQDTDREPAWDGYRLQPRYHGDIIAWPDIAPETGPAWPALLPETGGR